MLGLVSKTPILEGGYATLKDQISQKEEKKNYESFGHWGWFSHPKD
jgi:hypothetical protein